MVNVFIKRFWGFGAHWPIVSFSLPGSLDAMLGKLEAGDLVAFVGTKGSKTMEHEQVLTFLMEEDWLSGVLSHFLAPAPDDLPE